LADSDLEHKPQVAVSRNPDGQSAAGNVLEELTEATLDNWNMGRLTSTSKSKKPSLVSKLEQLPTPTPTKEPKPLKRAKDAAAPTASTSAPGMTLRYFFIANLGRHHYSPAEKTSWDAVEI
jgi:hypothetical protein